MNVYVVVEGRVVEKAVYQVWIPEVNNTLAPVQYLDEVVQNNFYIVSGEGYPYYFKIIDAALEDVGQGNTFDRLVICIDSEDVGLEDKRGEVTEHVTASAHAGIDYRVVVQHFCFEAWALGNRTIGPRHPQNPTLQRYRAFYNVATHDPEGLSSPPDEQLTRSQFAEKYLRLMLNDRNKNLTYSKSNPSVVAHPKYYHQLVWRLADTGHIKSFQAFIDAFL